MVTSRLLQRNQYFASISQTFIFLGYLGIDSHNISIIDVQQAELILMPKLLNNIILHN